MFLFILWLMLLNQALPLQAGSSSDVRPQPCSRFFLADSEPTITFNRLRHRQLWQWLAQPQTQGPQIIARLSENKIFNNLFNSSAGVVENYTIGQHTLRVYEIYYDQLNHFNLAEDLRLLVKFIISLHDIGKPLALEAGAKSLQHHYTTPLLVQTMANWGFSPSEIAIAQALTDHDLLGEYFKGEKTLKTTMAQLKRKAASTPLTLADFFELQLFFYTCDAGSYDYVRAKVFKRQHQKLVVKLASYPPLLAQLAEIIRAK